MQIKERENQITKKMKEITMGGGKIYLLGAGVLGNRCKEEVGLHGIGIDAFLVTKNFFEEGKSIDGVPVLCLEDMSEKKKFSSKDLLVVAIRDCDNGVVNRYRNELSIYKGDCSSYCAIDKKILDYDFLSAHWEEFETLYRELADDRSRICMDAFLNQKISGKFEYLDQVYDDGQYYDARIVDFSLIEGFVDCGAFDGDSYLTFREAYRLNAGKEYEGTAYLLEPNADYYQKMVTNCSHAGKNNIFLQCGAWHEQDRLFFHLRDASDNMSGMIDHSGTVSIDVNSIDHIVKGQKVDYIKMDIEGSELNALKGARNTIETCKPILAVCVYHKRDDLLTIPAYIRSICPDYHFYLRAYSRSCVELVLYAVCG